MLTKRTKFNPCYNYFELGRGTGARGGAMAFCRSGLGLNPKTNLGVFVQNIYSSWTLGFI